MTVGLATLVAAGVAGPATARAARALVGRPGVGHRPRARRLRERPEQAVAGYGGEVGRALDIINGFTAEVPVDRLDALRAVPGCRVGHGGRRARPVRAPIPPRRRPGGIAATRSPTR